ncbi:MAG: type IV pilus biogenesis/stability protein PilW [Pseudomonadota bacterium]|nr:type IV pilus biogenesis/stability protein PilW [Burkholderiales bacterium]MDQ3196268.1 type IV pilus biogenesis/stability protein PilW [Pseudomonadota bacterium]
MSDRGIPRLAKLALCALMLIATGCAQQPAQKDGAAVDGNAAQRAEIHTQLGSGYYERRQFDIAIQELNEALGAVPDYVPAHNLLGLVYMDLRDDAVAEKHFRQALKSDPADSDANNNYGWFLCQRGRETESIRYFVAALKNPLYKTPDKSYVNAGVCSLQAKDEKGAESYLLKALQIQPRNPQALYHLAETKYKGAKYAEARSYLGRYMQVANPSAESLWLGVRIERKLGDRNSQASYGLQLRKKYPESQEAAALRAGRYE